MSINNNYFNRHIFINNDDINLIDTINNDDINLIDTINNDDEDNNINLIQDYLNKNNIDFKDEINDMFKSKSEHKKKSNCKECKTQASFNYPNEKKVLYCFNHKKEDMINIRNRLCMIVNRMHHIVI